MIRTSLEQDVLSDEDRVRSCKSLSQVERAFRSLKAIDLQMRPIHHPLEDRVRAHVFEIITTPTAKQQQALDLLKQITV